MEYTSPTVEKYLDNSIQALVKYNMNGLIGVESASGYWGLSTFSTNIPILLINDDSMDNDGYDTDYAIKMLFVPNVNDKNTVKLSDSLSITDREQTVCDMIRYNRHEFHLYETVVSAYEDGEVDIPRLEQLAKEYGILDRLHTIYQQALTEESEDD